MKNMSYGGYYDIFEGNQPHGSDASQQVLIEDSILYGETGIFGLADWGGRVDQKVTFRENVMAAWRFGVGARAYADSFSSVVQLVDLSSGNTINAPVPVVVDPRTGSGDVRQEIIMAYPAGQ